MLAGLQFSNRRTRTHREHVSWLGWTAVCEPSYNTFVPACDRNGRTADNMIATYDRKI